MSWLKHRAFWVTPDEPRRRLGCCWVIAVKALFWACLHGGAIAAAVCPFRSRSHSTCFFFPYPMTGVPGATSDFPRLPPPPPPLLWAPTGEESAVSRPAWVG